MTAYSNEVRSQFERLENEELIERVQSGTLTDAAHEIAKQELTSRGLRVPEQQVSNQTTAEPKLIAGLYSSFRRAFTGKLELWRVFWKGALIPVFLMMIVDAIFSNDGNISSIAMRSYLLSFWFWMYAVLKCSPNVRTDLLGFLAKLYAGAMLVLVPIMFVGSLLPP